jgi:hypothetical protein
LGLMAYPKSKGQWGPQHASKAAIRLKALMVMRCSTRMIWQKLHCLKPNLQTVNVRTHRYNACNRCHALHRHEPGADATSSA